MTCRGPAPDATSRRSRDDSKPQASSRSSRLLRRRPAASPRRRHGSGGPRPSSRSTATRRSRAPRPHPSGGRQGVATPAPRAPGLSRHHSTPRFFASNRAALSRARARATGQPNDGHLLAGHVVLVRSAGTELVARTDPALVVRRDEGAPPARSGRRDVGQRRVGHRDATCPVASADVAPLGLVRGYCDERFLTAIDVHTASMSEDRRRDLPRRVLVAGRTANGVLAGGVTTSPRALVVGEHPWHATDACGRGREPRWRRRGSWEARVWGS